MLSPFEWWCRNFILPDICKPCLFVFLRNLFYLTFFSGKFDITKHPRYKYLADADKKNTFDIERYMKRRPAIVKPDEPFDLYELKATDLQPDNSTERKEM